MISNYSDINYKASTRLAELAKKCGVKSFVFASSCSVYGEGGTTAKKEESDLNPLTAYAKSKINTEIALQSMESENFQITCLRFATACGISPRLRLDLVLNDFVASALTANRIDILSDGSPWRPLINVKDMALAIDWAIHRSNIDSDNYCVINTGSNEWNYQIKDLAYAVRDIVDDVDVSINHDAEPDKRSYKVNFDKYNNLATNFIPKMTLKDTVIQLINGINESVGVEDNFRESDLIRLRHLRSLIKHQELDNNLCWSY